ncbi:MAG: hypothetical protein Q9162_002276 [Coniocarpon cinnabarinum]
MQFSAALIAAIAGLAAAAPTQSSSSNALAERQAGCFPWFIRAFQTSCVDATGFVDVASGPAPAPSTACTLITPDARAFPWANVNPDGCVDQNWSVSLYTAGDCSGVPTTVENNQCVNAAPGLGYVAYTTQLLAPPA